MSSTILKVNPLRIPIGLNQDTTVNELTTFLTNKKIPLYMKFTRGQTLGGVIGASGISYFIYSAFKKTPFLKQAIPTVVFSGIGFLFANTFKNYKLKIRKEPPYIGPSPLNGNPNNSPTDPDSPNSSAAANLPSLIPNIESYVNRTASKIKIAMGF